MVSIYANNIKLTSIVISSNDNEKLQGLPMKAEHIEKWPIGINVSKCPAQ